MQLLAALTLCHIIATGVSLRCYYCENYEEDSQWHYDPDCGVQDYQGNIDVCHDCDVCYVAIHEGGGDVPRVDRGGASGHSDGDCTNSRCYCKGDLCNNYLCGICTTTPQPPPTNATDYTTSTSSSDYTSGYTSDITSDYTSDHSTSYTTGSVASSTPTDYTTDQGTGYTPTDFTSETTVETSPYTPSATTPSVTSTPTEATDTTEPTDSTTLSSQATDTTEPTDSTTLSSQATDTTLPPTTTPPSIECFDCQMTEPSWDNYDPTCNLPDYQGNTYKCTNCHSCYTQVMEDGSVTRGEAGAFQDGQCLYGTDEQLNLDYVYCYCTNDLCNSNLCEECSSQFERMGNQTPSGH